MAVHRFARLELALKICCNEVPSAHGESALGGNRGECSQRCGTHCGAKGLLVVNSGDLRAALDAEPSFEGAVALPFVDPY
eukprot:263727-Pleurochrysis_carterae.AAC.5